MSEHDAGGQHEKVLLIEDSATDALLARAALTEAGFPDVAVARSLSEGTAALRAGAFGAVLLDLGLPDSQGLETLRRLLPACGEDTAVVVLTGHGDEALGVSTVQAGAQDYLQKSGIENAGVLRRSLMFSIERCRHAAVVRKLELARAEALAAEAERVEADRARDVAEASAQAKSRVLAMLSHEIRTPIHSMVNSAYLLSRMKVEDAERVELQKLQQASSRLLLMINDIIDYAKLEAGFLTVSEHPFDVVELLKAVAFVFDPMCRTKGLEFLVEELPPEFPRVLVGDSGRIRQILDNILANAVKFTTRGAVFLRVRPVGPGGQPETLRLRFEVEDTGEGMTAEEVSGLFEPFDERIDTGERRQPGSSLGMAVVKSLVDMLGGGIGVASEPGRGTHVWFELAFGTVAGEGADTGDWPVGQRTPLVLGYWGKSRRDIPRLESVCGKLGWQLRAIQSAENARTVWADGGMDCLLVDDHEAEASDLAAWGIVTARLPNLSSNLAPLEVFDAVNGCLVKGGRGLSFAFDHTDISIGNYRWLRSAVVLIVDDNQQSLMSASRILESFGARVLTALSGHDALELVEERAWEIELILIDLQMPEMDGCETSLQIRKIRKAENIPIVGMTAGATRTERERAVSSGMSDVVVKPQKTLALVRTVRRHVETRRNRPMRLLVSMAGDDAHA